jgi:hypothetical protein
MRALLRLDAELVREPAPALDVGADHGRVTRGRRVDGSATGGDAELLAEVRRRIGDGVVDLRLANA